MKIGILSMQKILNYGSFLQAYSLKKQMELLGNDVYFIDIKKGKELNFSNEENPSESRFEFIKSRIFNKYVFKKIKHFFFFKKMSDIHIKDYTDYLEVDKSIGNDEKYDLAIIGSDEVFNCCVPSAWGFSKQLFGDIKNANHVVTYAASCGSTTYENAVEFGIENELRDAMANLEHISVRDENTYKFVKSITGKEPILHLDPVFLSDFPEVEVKLPKKPYMLVYAYANRICDKNEINKIKKYAKKNNLEIICVGMFQEWCKNCIAANGFELLQYVKNASCVVTDTFHGTVFSIKYNKRFGVIVRDSNYNKLYGLLDAFNLTERLLDKEFDSVLDKEVDFSYANERIEKYKDLASQYFKEITTF